MIKLVYPKTAHPPKLRSSKASINLTVYTSEVVYLPLKLERFEALLCELTCSSRCVAFRCSRCLLCPTLLEGLLRNYDSTRKDYKGMRNSTKRGYNLDSLDPFA